MANNPNNKASLTIGVLAYNVEKTLRCTLDSIIDQLEKINDLCDLEILISDNCSTDSTAKIALEYQAKYPNIINYHKNKTNVGFDGNLKAICQNATKEYIWFFGDDVFVGGAIRNFCELIQGCTKNNQPKPSVITTCSTPSQDVTNKNIIINFGQHSNQNFTYNNIYDFRKDGKFSVLNLCFVSVTIVKREKLLPLIADMDVKNYYPHADLAWKIAKTEPIAVMDRLSIINQEVSYFKRENAEFISFVPISYLITLKNIFGNFAILRRQDTKGCTNHIFSIVYGFRKKIKNPKQIIEALKEVDFMPKILLRGLDLFSALGYKTAFRFFVFYVSADKIFRSIKKKNNEISLYNAAVLTIILILLIIKS